MIGYDRKADQDQYDTPENIPAEVSGHIPSLLLTFYKTGYHHAAFAVKPG
jgi:hypothetical protein